MHPVGLQRVQWNSDAGKEAFIHVDVDKLISGCVKDLKTPERITSIEMVILGGFWRIFLFWELDSYRCKEERSPSMESVKPEGVLLQKQATWLALSCNTWERDPRSFKDLPHRCWNFPFVAAERASAKVLDDYCCMRTLSRFPKLQSVAWQPWWSVPSGWLKLPR